MKHLGRMAVTALAGIMLCGQSAPDAPVPLESFAELPTLEGARLSPNGERVAAKRSINGKLYLVVMPLFQNAGMKPAIARVGEDVDVNWWRWVNDDWLVVGVGGTQNLYGEEVYITRTIGIRADMSAANRIDWSGSGLRADDLLWVANDGSPRILLARQTGIERIEQFYPSVIEADVSTGRIKRVSGALTNVYSWSADAQGRLRMGHRFIDATGRSELLYRPGGEGAFRPIAVSKSESDAFVTPLAFGADGGAIGIDDNDGYDNVYDLSLPDLKLGGKLFGVEGYDVDGVVMNRAGDGVDGVIVTDRFTHTVWKNPALKQVQDDMDKALGGRRAQIISWNDERSVFLVEVGSPAQAGALYYFDPAEGKMQRYAWQNEDLKGRTLSPVRTIRYAARDGTSIEAVLTLPRGRKPEKLPIIVMPHGGPFARDSESWDWWAQYLAETGYIVIQPNYRGSSGYGTAFAKLGEGEWGLKMQDDLNDALAWAAKEGLADPRRACMIGASYGGYAAMRAAQRDGNLYRCAVSYAGVSDLPAMQRYDSRFLFGNTRKKWLKKQAPDFRAVSPRAGAASFSTPILLAHGKADKRVPVAQSRTMASALRNAGKPYEYLEQPLGDHHFSRREDRIEFLKAMKAFLDKHNPA